jgi:hypothetical protein
MATAKGPAMTSVFAVVGQHREDPERLLLLGADGQHYALALPDGDPDPVQPDEDWELDPPAPPAEELSLAQ